MSFNKRRGRPKKIIIEQKDYGTNELISKRNLNLTKEPLDLCLEKSIITEAQHRAGIHFRWLHSIKFGIPSLTISPSILKNYSRQSDDIAWRSEREKEYFAAVDSLEKLGSKNHILNICIYNKMPRFLLADFSHCSDFERSVFFFDYNRLLGGLKLLEELWSYHQRKFSE